MGFDKVVIVFLFFLEKRESDAAIREAQAPSGRGGGTRAHAQPTPHSHTAMPAA